MNKKQREKAKKTRALTKALEKMILEVRKSEMLTGEDMAIRITPCDPELIDEGPSARRSIAPTEDNK